MSKTRKSLKYRASIILLLSWSCGGWQLQQTNVDQHSSDLSKNNAEWEAGTGDSGGVPGDMLRILIRPKQCCDEIIKETNKLLHRDRCCRLLPSLFFISRNRGKLFVQHTFQWWCIYILTTRTNCATCHIQLCNQNLFRMWRTNNYSIFVNVF